MIPDLPEYEKYVYSLPETHPSIISSHLIVKRTSAHSAQTVGIIYFNKDITLHVLETIDFIDHEIIDYSYEIRQGFEKLYWYDCWPHADDPEWASPIHIINIFHLI
jgi:hypothetical protein